MRKKFLRTLITGVLSITLLASNALAAVEIDPVSETGTNCRDGNIYVRGDIGVERAEDVIVIVTSTSFDGNFTANNLVANAYTMGQTTARPDGTFEIRLRLKNVFDEGTGTYNYPSGSYKVYAISATGEKSAGLTLTYTNPYEIRNSLDILSRVTEASAFLGEFQNSQAAFGTIVPYYDNLSGQAQFDFGLKWATSMMALRPATGYGTTTDVFNSHAKTAAYMAQLNSLSNPADVNDFLREAATVSALNVESAFLSLDAVEDATLITEICTDIVNNPKQTPQELKAFMSEKLIVKLFQSVTKKEDIELLIEQFPSVIHLDAATGNKFNDIISRGTDYLVYKDMYDKKVAGIRTFATIADIQAAYMDAVNAVYALPTPTRDPGQDLPYGDSYGDISGIGVISPVVDDTMKKKAFTDLDGYGWAKDAIYELVEKGVLSGYGDGTFRPGDKVTREQYVTMLVNRYHVTQDADISSFADVKQGVWYYDYVVNGVGGGLVYGLSDTEFGVGKPITRQDLAVMAYRAMGSKYVATGTTALLDIDSVADYARTAVEALYEMKIVSGDEHGNFRPRDNATRAEAARILYLLK